MISVLVTIGVLFLGLKLAGAVLSLLGRALGFIFSGIGFLILGVIILAIIL